MANGSDPSMEALLEYVREARGFDFTGYKRPSLERRIGRRMADLNVRDHEAYLDRLQADPDEFTALFNTILINLTSFFRDPPVWELVAKDVIPRMLSMKSKAASIRGWCAGCATGEEAYTLAILLATELGLEAFRERVKIFATDVDEDALQVARQGRYPAKSLQAIPDGYVHSFFTAEADGGTFVPDLRRGVIFGRHDLVQDAPISRTDIVLCRNTLMYLNSDTQSRVVDNLAFSLNEGGFMILGKSEMVFSKLRAFAPVDLKRRIFVKTDGSRASTVMGVGEMPRDGLERRGNERLAFDLGPVAEIVIDVEGKLQQANRRARELLGLRRQDLGKEFFRFESSYRPVELRPPIDESQKTGQALAIRGVATKTPEGRELILDIQVIPLLRGDETLGTIVTFTDVTEFHRLRVDVERSNEELETAMEELQSTNEELETTNEELQSTNEELETTNEELQSSNEELETTNEELQSSNEELETTNEELQLRTTELARANRLMDLVMETLGAAVAVLGVDLRVRAWSIECEGLWGVREAETRGRHLRDLDIGLPAGPVEELVRSVLTTGSTSEEVVDAHDRRGTAFRCRIVASVLDGVRDAEPDGVMVVMRRGSTLG